jgi:hypothetical protein
LVALLRKDSATFALCFTACFFDLSVIFVGEVGISVFTLTALLFTGFVLTNKLFVSRSASASKSVLILFLWLCYLFISIFFPFFVGDVIVLPYTNDYLDLYYEPLRASLGSIKALFYPILYGLTALSLALHVRRKDQMNGAVNGLILGGLVVGVSGLLVQIVMFFDFDGGLNLLALLTRGDLMTDEIFARVNHQSFFGLKRMYSFAGEPGFTGNLLVLISCIALARSSNIDGVADRIKLQSKTIGLAVGVLAVLTLSTAALLGVIVTLLALAYIDSRNFLTALVSLTVAALIVAVVALSFPPVRDYLIENHLMKIFGSSGSGGIRLLNAQLSAGLFVEHPILGLGYGSHRSTTLLLSLLVNVGLLGTLIFFWLVGTAILRGLAFRTVSGAAYGLSIGLLVWSVTAPISQTGVGLLFPWIWICIGLLLSTLFSRITPNPETSYVPESTFS